MSKEFIKLLKNAADIERQCKEYDRPVRLTAKAFLRDACMFSKTSPGKLKDLRTALEKSPEKFERCRGFHTFAVQQIRDGSVRSADLKPLHLRWLSRGDFDGVCTELSPLASNPYELFALAVSTAAERHPEVFGEIENWDGHYQKANQLTSLRDKLFKQITESYQPDDVTIGTPNKDGLALVTFKISNGEVPVAPVENAGERLVGWALQHPEVLR